MDLRKELESEVVVLNVYDATQWRFIEAFNRAAYHLGTGAYHVGVEVHRQEWSFGRAASGSGVSFVRPRLHPSHRFRGAIKMGSTTYNRAQVASILLEMSGCWLGGDYNILTRNCVHFAHAFALRLGVGPVPAWLDRLARAASAVASPLDHAAHAVGSLSSACRCTGPLQCCSGESERSQVAAAPSRSPMSPSAPWYSSLRSTSRSKVMPWARTSASGSKDQLSDRFSAVVHLDSAPPAAVSSSRPRTRANGAPRCPGDFCVGNVGDNKKGASASEGEEDSERRLELVKCTKPQASEAAPEPPPRSGGTCGGARSSSASKPA